MIVSELLCIAMNRYERIILFVRGEGSLLLMHLGDPESGPPEMTWREFLEKYHTDSLQDVASSWSISESELDDIIDPGIVIESWERTDSPCARAHHFLSYLDLGHSLSGPNAVGGLDFIDGFGPGWDYLGVAVDDHISISLLQQRLNDLGTGIRVILI